MPGDLPHSLNFVKRATDRYRSGRITIEDLQADIEPMISALEGLADQRLEAALRKFVARLEYIRFMSEHHEQTELVGQEIRLLRDEISSYEDKNGP